MAQFYFDGYCTMDSDIVFAIKSAPPVITSGDFVYFSNAVFNGSVLTYTASVVPLTGGNTVSRSFNQTFSTCPNLGPIHNQTGLTLSDVTQVSWLVATALISAWAIKHLSRAL